MASPTPTSSGRGKLLLSVAIIVIVLGAGSYGIYSVFGPKPPKPEMTLIDITTQDAQSGCGFIFRNPQEVGAAFTIVNTGKADGFVSVSMSGGGGILVNNTYLVKTGQSDNEVLSTSVDCSANFVVSVWISQVRSI
jgi:hypothetical protein